MLSGKGTGKALKVLLKGVSSCESLSEKCRASVIKNRMINIPERKKILASRIALGRVGLAKDIGGVVAFLCSEDGGWINGQRIEISGGMNL